MIRYWQRRPMLSPADYRRLSDLVFRADYPGFTPDILEVPNGDGRVDTGKRYAHIADRHLSGDVAGRDFLLQKLDEAHALALRVADALGVPEAFRPVRSQGALRVLEYPAGAGANPHTDFDLFTLMLYRDQPDCFVSDWHDMPAAIRDLNAQCHLGELCEMLGVGRAVRHEVLPSAAPQRSIVYFALPNPDLALPHRDGTAQTVGEWLAERKGRARLHAGAAERKNGSIR